MSRNRKCKPGNKYQDDFLLAVSKQYIMLIRNIIAAHRRECWPTNLSEIFDGVKEMVDDEEKNCGGVSDVKSFIGNCTKMQAILVWQKKQCRESKLGMQEIREKTNNRLASA